MKLKQNFTCDVTIEDFARSFGTTAADISPHCRELISKHDFRYKVLSGKERDKVIINVLDKLESDRQIIGAPDRQSTWEKGWEENLRDFVNSGYDLDKLVPKFIRPNQAIRLNQEYILPKDANFELNYFSVLRLWLFEKYLKNYNSIYEFGCGTGFNLVALASLYPKKKLYGLDFVPSSRDLVNKLGEVYKNNISGRLFDMIHPDENLILEDNSAIFTIGAIEQLASKIEPFLQFILKRSPSLCLHVEPTIELYDGENLTDYLAVKFHKKRGYTENLLTRLRELETQNKVQILSVKRPYFGSLYMEGYSYIVWKPL